MKHAMPHRNRTVLLFVFLALFGLVPAHATSNLTDDKLLSDAYQAYVQNDWLQAALLFSAYLDRNPPLLQSDSQRRENAYALHDYAISRLQYGLDAAVRLPTVESNLYSCRNALQACSDSDVGSSGQFIKVPTPLPPTPIPLLNRSILFKDGDLDNIGEIDISWMEMQFDSATGAYLITLKAHPEHPFQGFFRINLNLFNADTDCTKQGDSHQCLFQDVANDFELSTPTEYVVLRGRTSYLTHWEVGDRVAPSGPIPLGLPPGTSLFRSGVDDDFSDGFPMCDELAQNLFASVTSR